MRSVDVGNIIRFNSRMGMFLSLIDRAGVVAFFAGYEYASAGECGFTSMLSEHLTKRHRVKCNAQGWPQQIASLAERRGLDWMEVYLRVSSEVLSVASESSTDSR